MNQNFFHITSKELWKKAQELGHYHHPSLDDEKFIHASYEDQVDRTLKKYFIGQTDLLLLELNPEKLTSAVKVEDLFNKGVLFPHIYGPINLDCVIKVTDIENE